MQMEVSEQNPDQESHSQDSLQCRRFWWFSSFECLAAILDSLQTGRIGTRMRE